MSPINCGHTSYNRFQKEADLSKGQGKNESNKWERETPLILLVAKAQCQKKDFPSVNGTDSRYLRAFWLAGVF